MTTQTMRMSATVVASMTRSTLVPSRMFEAASAHTPARAMAPTRNGAQAGVLHLGDQVPGRPAGHAGEPVPLDRRPRLQVQVRELPVQQTDDVQIPLVGQLV